MDSGVEALNAISVGAFPGLLGLHVLEHERGRIVATVPLRSELLAPNGFLHAAVVIGLADTACGYGCRALLPEGSTGFTTIELKANFLGTALDGDIVTTASVAHAGRTTQVWDAEVKHRQTDKTIALFRCTQAVLWPRP
ncbi:MAG: PaaI family thioesterase [Geodermatophilaceae bacterium]|nr:PaaI family thioesterase [Geodermatophilaceae bacterium]